MFYKQNILKVKHLVKYIVLRIKGVRINNGKPHIFCRFLPISYEKCRTGIPCIQSSSDWIIVKYQNDASRALQFFVLDVQLQFASISLPLTVSEARPLTFLPHINSNIVLPCPSSVSNLALRVILGTRFYNKSIIKYYIFIISP